MLVMHLLSRTPAEQRSLSLVHVIVNPHFSTLCRLALVVLLVLSLALFGCGKGEPEKAVQPLWAEIEPKDGAVIQGTKVWIRWSPEAEATGRVFWRTAGEKDFRTVEATPGDTLIARLAPLHSEKKYEYVVEQTAEDWVQRSDVRTFTVQTGLAFDPPTVEQTIHRDYDQTAKLTLRNNSQEKVLVAAKALAQFDDLPADIVGLGSVDQPEELAPGEKLNLRLAIFAADATQKTYEIPVEAAGTFAVVRVHLKAPNVKLSFHVVKEDPLTLAQTVEVRNEGDTLADLAVRIAPPNDTEVWLQPNVNHARLTSGEALRIVATPLLYLEFKSLKVELEATAAGKRKRFSLKFEAPAGRRLIGVRTASVGESKDESEKCTNEGNPCNTVDGVAENGPTGTTPLPGPEPQPAPTPPQARLELSGGESPNGSLLVLDITDSVPTLVLASAAHMGTDKPFVVGASVKEKERVLAQAGGSSAAGKTKNGTGDADDEGATTVSMHDFFPPEPAWGCEPPCDDKKKANECLADATTNKVVLQVLEKRISAKERELQELQQNQTIPPTRREMREEELRSEILGLLAKFDEWVQKCHEIKKNCEECPPPLNCPRDPQMREKELEGWKSALREVGKSLREADRYTLSSILRTLCRYETGKKIVEKIENALPTIFKETVKFSDEKVPKAKIDLCDPWTALYFFDVLQANAVVIGDLLIEIAENDPPSPIYRQVAQPFADPAKLAPRVNIPETVRTAINANAWASADLRAHAASYERYQGAKLVNDTEAMLLQAKAMLRYVERALAARRSAIHNWHQWQSTFLSAFEAGLKEVDTLGGWERVLSAYPEQVGKKALAPEGRKAMLEAGIPETEVSVIEKQFKAITPSTTKRFIARLKIRLSMIEELRKELGRGIPNLGWPEPPELVHLVQLRRFSSHLISDAESALGAERVEGGFRIKQISLRPGLVGALQRRASFTRAHRGPLGAPVEGDIPDSSDMAAEWHTGDRVLFAWHQHKDKVVFAVFDPRGETMVEPLVIGNGRWPRLAAAGKRTAVAWRSGDRFAVRLHDGKQWIKEIDLSGQGAAIAFSPDGTLYAATSTGLWKLTGARFERIREASYSQPAIAVDANGQPHLAWQRDGRIVYGEVDLGEGQRPSLVIAPDGTVHIAYLSDGSLVLRSQKAKQWSAPETILAENPSWPVVAFGTDGLRLTYFGAAEHGPDALWLVRETDNQPLLLPSLAGNVTDAWIALRFRLTQPRSKYRPHDILVMVNDVWIKMFENTVPDGRYLFRLNPYQLYYSGVRPAPNRVQIHALNRNRGDYIKIGNYRLIVRMAWSERYAFASSKEEVLRSVAGNPHPKHDLADLVVLANSVELPVETPQRGRIELSVTIANLGETESQRARLEMLHRDRLLTTAEVLPLKYGEMHTVTMPLDYDGQIKSISFRIVQEKPDFDPANDRLNLTLWEPPAVPPTPSPVPVPVPVAEDTGIRLEVAEGLGQLYRWSLVKPGQLKEVLHKQRGTDLVANVPPGEYQVAVMPFDNRSRNLLWPEQIQVKLGEFTTVRLDSGIKLVLPQEAGSIRAWSVVKVGQPDQAVQQYWSSGAEARVMLVPPGEYQVAIKPTEHYSDRLVWPDRIHVKAGQLTTVRFESGIRLVLPQEAGPIHTWSVVKVSQPDEAVQRYGGGGWVAKRRVMLVPPGEYQIAIKPTEHYSNRLVWPDRIHVKAGQLTTVRLDSGIKLILPEEAGSIYSWSVVKVGQPDEVMQSYWGGGWQAKLRVMLVPQGTYDIYWQRNSSQEPQRVKQDLTVKTDKLHEVLVRP